MLPEVWYFTGMNRLVSSFSVFLQSTPLKMGLFVDDLDIKAHLECFCDRRELLAESRVLRK